MGALGKEHRESGTLATARRVLALSAGQLASPLWSLMPERPHFI